MSGLDVVAVVGLAAAFWTVGFQILLASGAPLGHLAWGGAHSGRLPQRLRVASLASAALVAVLAAAYGQAAGFWTVIPEATLKWVFAAFTALFSLSFVGNLASKSRWERLHGVPLTLILALTSGALTVNSAGD